MRSNRRQAAGSAGTPVSERTREDGARQAIAFIVTDLVRAHAVLCAAQLSAIDLAGGLDTEAAAQRLLEAAVLLQRSAVWLEYALDEMRDAGWLVSQ
jgi:hypothetical protein